MFLSCAGGTASPGLLASLRAALEVNEARAGELARITALAAHTGVPSLASLDAHVKLLQVMGASSGMGVRLARAVPP